jgi:hypothetical protein
MTDRSFLIEDYNNNTHFGLTTNLICNRVTLNLFRQLCILHVFFYLTTLSANQKKYNCSHANQLSNSGF